jgi:hypothetical protein
VLMPAGSIEGNSLEIAPYCTLHLTLGAMVGTYCLNVRLKW